MQSLLTRFLLLCLSLFCGWSQTFAQSTSPTPTPTPISSPTPLRLDIEFEGPWMFYVDNQFPGHDSTKVSMLIAISPKLRSHRRPTFSTGDGYRIEHLGVYCLGFDDPTSGNPISCRTYGKGTKLMYTPCADASCPPYSNPNLVEMHKGDFDWTKQTKGAYIIALPIPDYYSADGEDTKTFLSTASVEKSMPAAIGVQFHYNAGPDKVNLLWCDPKSQPSIESCSSPYSTEQPNSGTLRISITSPFENSKIFPECHVQSAYRKMFNWVDPKHRYNQDRVDVETKCPLLMLDRYMKPGDDDHSPSSLSIERGLRNVFLSKHRFENCGTGFENRANSGLCNLYRFSETLTDGKILSRSELILANELLQKSLNQLAKKEGAWSLTARKKLLALEVQFYGGVDGVDCRALEMMIND